MRKIRMIAIFMIAATTIAYGATYTLTSASYPINVNGVKQTVQPLNLNGVTYLPLRSISDAVGVPITWNTAKRSVEINTVDIDKLKAACVMLYASDGKTKVQGSGVYIDYDQVLTADHLINDNRTNVRTSDGDTFTFEDSSSTLDALTLDASDEVKPVKIGDSDEVKSGDQVILISSPEGKENAVTYGLVSTDYNDRWMIYATTYGGSSGGACFNSKGELIGIAVQANEKFYTMVPINDIRKAL